mgnify:CR=1 FL=1
MFRESGNRRYCRPELPFRPMKEESKALLDHLQAAVSTPSPFIVDLGCQYDLLNPTGAYEQDTPARKQQEYKYSGIDRM